MWERVIEIRVQREKRAPELVKKSLFMHFLKEW